MDWVGPGAVLAGKFKLELKLGQGGMGAVWRAEHIQLRSPVAIKLIDELIAQNPEALARFLREAQSAAALRSPHVVQILDYGADRGVPYIAMELLEGESLADRLDRVGRLGPAEVARVMTEVARAIGKAHELSIVHRDLKPDNIFLVKNDEVEVTKVLDFGIAKATQGLGVASASETRTGAILGTPHYMSPEQAEGTKLVDHRTDLWALGVIAFECLVGRRPFDSDALGSLLLAICTRPIPVPSAWGLELPGFDAWFAKACARELPERFQSARELAAELRRVIGGAVGTDMTLVDESRGPGAFAKTAAMNTPFVTVPATAGVPSGRPLSEPRRGVAGWALGGVVALVLAGIAAFVLRESPAEPSVPASAPAAVAAAPEVPALPVPPEPRVVATAAPVASATPSAVATPSVAPVLSAPPPTTPARPKTPVRRNEKPPPPKPASTGVNLGI
jgi:eukaryotic-like serine/threonine-protein kinase